MANFTIEQLREAKRKFIKITNGNFERSQYPANWKWGTSARICYFGSDGKHTYTLLIAEYGIYLYRLNKRDYGFTNPYKTIKKWVKY